MGLVYLAGAIDYVGQEERITWRESAQNALGRYGVSSYDPSKAFDYHNNGSLELSEALENINNSAMFNSSHILFYMPRAINSVGTVTELNTLVQELNKNNAWAGKRVYVVVPDANDISEISAYLIGLVGNKIKLLFGQGALSHTLVDIVETDREIATSQPKHQKEVSEAVFPKFK